MGCRVGAGNALNQFVAQLQHERKVNDDLQKDLMQANEVNIALAQDRDRAQQGALQAEARADRLENQLKNITTQKDRLLVLLAQSHGTRIDLRNRITTLEEREKELTGKLREFIQRNRNGRQQLHSVERTLAEEKNQREEAIRAAEIHAQNEAELKIFRENKKAQCYRELATFRTQYQTEISVLSNMGCGPVWHDPLSWFRGSRTVSQIASLPLRVMMDLTNVVKNTDSTLEVIQKIDRIRQTLNTLREEELATDPNTPPIDETLFAPFEALRFNLQIE